jgi:cytochrome c556
MLRIAAIAAACAVCVTAAFAQNAAVIKERREAMRTIAKAGSGPFRMTKGDIPFELAPVQATLKTIIEQAPKFKTLFPDDSKTGDTDATAAIWAKRAEFNALVDKWASDAVAVQAAIKDEASFKAEYPKLTQACGGCHKASDGFAPALSESFKKMQTPLN